MSEISISSLVYVNQAVTPTNRLQELLGISVLELTLENRQVLESLQDRSEQEYSLSFVGSGLREAYTKLKRLEVNRLLNGQPRYTIDGYADAVAQTQGELITIEISLYNTGQIGNLEVVRRTGILRNVSMSIQSSFLQQRLQAIFQICNRLHVRDLGIVTTFTQVD